MHSNTYKFEFKLAFYCSALVIKVVRVVSSWKVKIITVNPKPSLLLNALLYGHAHSSL